MNRAPAVLTALVLLAGCSKHEEPEPKPVVAVKVATAERTDLRLSLRAPAVIHPRQQANIAARITATIQELPVRKGDRVEAGALVAKLENRDMLAQRAEGEAALHQAEVLAERRTRLFAEGAIPQKDLLAAQTDLAQSRARLDLIDTQLKFAELRSPFAGTITEQLLYPGDLAQPSSPVFTVADLSFAVARTQVPESEAAAIRLRQECAFAPAGSPGDSFFGRITVINRAVDLARRTIEVWCEIQEARGRLLPGAFGEVRVVTGTAPNSVVVPRAAVQFSEGTHQGSVFVVDNNKVAHSRDVEAGEVVEDKAQITDGLKAGEVVIVEGGYGLPDGTSVKITDDAEKAEKNEAEKPGKKAKAQ